MSLPKLLIVLCMQKSFKLKKEKYFQHLVNVKLIEVKAFLINICTTDNQPGIEFVLYRDFPDFRMLVFAGVCVPLPAHVCTQGCFGFPCIARRDIGPCVPQAMDTQPQKLSFNQISRLEKVVYVIIRNRTRLVTMNPQQHGISKPMPGFCWTQHRVNKSFQSKYHVFPWVFYLLLSIGCIISETNSSTERAVPRIHRRKLLILLVLIYKIA